MNRPFYLLVMLFLCLSGFRLGAVEVVEGPTVEVTGTAAVIRWTTDVECGTTLKYGTDPNHLNHKEEGALGLIHEVKLTDLEDGQTYHFAAGTSKKSLKLGQFAVGTPKPAATQAETAPPTNEAKPVKQKPKAESTPAPEARTAPPSKQTWGDPSSLRDHFVRHGRDFGATSAEHYAQLAWEFLQRAMDEGLPTKMDENGVLRVYEARTKSFAAYNRNGTTKTFFKPERADYFTDQPGKIVRLKRPEPKPAADDSKKD